MRINSRTACMSAFLLSLVAGALLLVGCSRMSDPGSSPVPPQVVTPQIKETIEMMPPNSEEFLRRHLVDSTGFEIETHIDYRNGEKAVVKMRPDNTKAEYRRVAKDGTVRIEQIFAADGKTVIGGLERRPDLTLKFTISRSASGAITTNTYWWDGKTLFSEKTVETNGAYKVTYYYKNGNYWLSRSGPKEGTVTKEVWFRRDGTRELAREPGNNEVIVTIYRTDGTPQFRQHVVETSSSYGYTYKTMKWIEEFNADGSEVVRQLHMNESGYSMVKSVRFNDDGTTTIRTVTDYYGTVSHEEVRDYDGTIISEKDFTDNDNEREEWDRAATRDPYMQDPSYAWDLQERYPYYRNQP